MGRVTTASAPPTPGPSRSSSKRTARPRKALSRSRPPSLFHRKVPPQPADDPAEEVRSPCRPVGLPTRTIRWKGGTIPIEKVGMRITQCILLSFPSQVILQDWPAPRVPPTTSIVASKSSRPAPPRTPTRAPSATSSSGWANAEPTEEPPPPGHGRLLPGVPKHHDHWHVSYHPSDVEAPPDGREAALLWIEAHLPEILRLSRGLVE